MPESNLFNLYNYRCLDHPENELQKRENLDIAIRFLTTVEKVPHIDISKFNFIVDHIASSS